jgi:CobQ-like glutamine amidotransferase family enzyme
MALKSITVVHLYAKEMNIYGDTGNVLSLAWRLKQHGYQAEQVVVNAGQRLPKNVDIIIAGGGQDSGQTKVQDDLGRRGQTLQKVSDDGVVILAICGMYQLLGHYFETETGDVIPGVGVFDMYTKAENKRLIGNVVADSSYGRLVGFENHSGQTYLGEAQLPLAKVRKGWGNNATDNKEGAVVANTFGTYLHGPILPKNPQFADELIRRAVERRYGSFSPQAIDDTYADKAAAIAAKRA